MERMIWRLTSATIVLFWAVMTGLIIRDAYFPDSSRFAEVPPRMVFETFLSQAAAFNNQLHLYHDREKIGHAHLTINKVKEEAGPTVYAILLTGNISGSADEAPGLATRFNLRAELQNGDQWRSFQLQTKTSAMQTVGKLAWKKGDTMPTIEVKKGDEIVLNSEIVQAMIAINGGLGLAGGMPGGMNGGEQLDWMTQLSRSATGGQSLNVELKAREGVMDLAGKSRRCYILSASLLKTYEVKFFFTELGELARIEMPGGYRFVEPMMHGLEPGMNTLE